MTLCFILPQEKTVFHCAELLFLAHLAWLHNQTHLLHTGQERMVYEGIRRANEKAARDLLKAPMRRHDFRIRFNRYMDTHPDYDVRTGAMDWFTEVLMTEA